MKRLFTALFIIGSFLVFSAPAAARSYTYDSVDVDYIVNRDSTVDVTETQVFNYDGAFNKGWRSISLKGTDAVTDIVVVDGETDKSLVRAFGDLDKTDPSNWGKYTVSKGLGKTDVSWYYSLADTTHEWIIKYKLHGAVSFLKDKDELYWNAIGYEYEVPIKSSTVTVTIPEGADIGGLSSSVYIDEKGDFSAMKEIVGPKTFRFTAVNIPVGSPFTIAAGWPKGLVDKGSFWKDFLRIHWQWPAMVPVLIAFIFVWKEVKRRKEAGRGTIVPQYEPPQGLKPAMASILIYGYTSMKAWPATIIDLAVRGYVSIEEREATPAEKAMDKAGLVVLIFVFAFIAFSFTVPFLALTGFLSLFSGLSFLVLIPIVLMLGLLLFSFWKASMKAMKKPRYVVRRTEKEYGPDVEDYEIAVMDLIFSEGDLDTGKISKSVSRSNELSRGFLEIDSKMRKETESDTGAYEKRSIRHTAIAVIAGIGGFFGIIGSLFLFIFQPFLSAIIFGSSVTALLAFCSPRLTGSGKVLREDWLGFRMYLETAEKYRLQNLTPDMFERYLPYAMIFGIEEKWAKAFAGLNVPSPDWYTSTAAGTSVAHAFSPSAFSTGFSNSFSSAFATSSGSSGASGGGGSSGGGGGGGGGGAS